MKPKALLWGLLLLTNIVGAILIFFMPVDLPKQVSFIHTSTPLAARSTEIAAVPVQVRSAIPIRLSIPKIKVDAVIESVGLTSTGEVGVPKGPAPAAWFNLGPRPGEKGSSIISGHYGWKNNIPAVFDNLHTLKKGDKIYIKDANGTTTTFVVRKLQTFRQGDNFSDVFASSDGKAHLNLITCGGVWDKVKKLYSNRVVAFADAQ